MDYRLEWVEVSMYELQRRQAQIEEFRRQIELLKRGSDQDRVRQVVYQMYNARLLPQPVVMLLNLVVVFSPGLAVSMLSSSLEAAARRTIR
jgi:hypothetical protein